MSRSLSLTVFTVVFAAVYILCFVNGWTLFRYYPLSGEITTLDLPRSAGPAMGWYAWIVQGFVAAVATTLLAIIIPKKYADKIWSGCAALGIALIIFYTLYYEWHWFQGK